MKYLKTYESHNSKEILNNIEDIFRDIEDLGCTVEYNKGAVGELTRIYIEKLGTINVPLSFIPPQVFVLSIQHLVSYLIKDYDIEIETRNDTTIIDHLSSKSEDGLIENDVEVISKSRIDFIKIVIYEKYPSDYYEGFLNFFRKKDKIRPKGADYDKVLELSSDCFVELVDKGYTVDNKYMENPYVQITKHPITEVVKIKIIHISLLMLKMMY